MSSVSTSVIIPDYSAGNNRFMSLDWPRLWPRCQITQAAYTLDYLASCSLHRCAARAQEPDTEVMASMLEAVEEIVQLLDARLLPAERLGVTFERLRDVLADSARRRAERRAAARG